jgi:hypothetical protein
VKSAWKASKLVFFAIYKYINEVKNDEIGKICSMDSNTQECKQGFW